MSEKLKHCPFCGENKIEIGEVLIGKNGNKLPSVWCGNCGARITVPKKYQEDAVKYWNSRVLDVSKEDLITLERLLKHDIYTRMKDYVTEYEEYKNVCAHNDIVPYHLQPMLDACNLMAKMEKLLFAIMSEKEIEQEGDEK